MALDSTSDRRQHFAKWLTSPKNPYFARNLVNRVWANFMGRGLVDPVDDVRDANASSNEELFGALIQDFIAHQFDVRHLMRPGGRVFYVRDRRGGAHLLPQRVERFEVFLQQFSQATGIDTSSIGRLSPPWTYQLLAVLTGLFLAGELAIAGWAH